MKTVFRLIIGYYSGAQTPTASRAGRLVGPAAEKAEPPPADDVVGIDPGRLRDVSKRLLAAAAVV
jgi:hypothetical protein